MSGKLHAHLRSNVIGYVAIFLFAIGGTAYATHPGGANTVSSGDIINGQVRNADIGTDAVTSNRIAPGGVFAGDLATNSVSSPKVVNGSLTNADVADTSSLGTAEIDESSLVGVDAEQVDGGDLCRTDGTLSVPDVFPSVPVTVCTTDSLELEAHCINTDFTVGQLQLDTTADDTFVTSDRTDDSNFDADEGTVTLIETPNGTAPPGAVATGDTSFAAGNADGSQLAGSATVRAISDGGNSRCEFVVGATD